MYIEKNINTAYGIPVTHHKIKALHIYFDEGVSHVDVGEYPSITACQNCSNTPALAVEQIEINQTTFTNETEIYNAILATQIFDGGILIQEP